MPFESFAGLEESGTYVLRCIGEGLLDAHIAPGDYLVVNSKSPRPDQVGLFTREDGSVVVRLIIRLLWGSERGVIDGNPTYHVGPVFEHTPQKEEYLLMGNCRGTVKAIIRKFN